MRKVLVTALGVALASTATSSHTPKEPTPPCILASMVGGCDPSAVRVEVRLEGLVAYVESLQVAPDAPDVASAPTTGGDLFRAYCASCHGLDARGAGPVAEQLRSIPPDLTEYALRNGGVFPRARLRQIIEGRHVPVHGNTEMPVWGWAFMRGRGVDGIGVEARIDALVSHLESLQKRPGD
jgi:mono/diheme cytochrome c family protein